MKSSGCIGRRRESSIVNIKFPKVYAAKHTDEEIREASRSGGVFTALSDYVLANGGVVYGCALTDDFNAVHIRADNKRERNRMRGSKYIQSNLGDTFKYVKNDLERERKVLFSGTSCQVAGLKSFLGEEYGNLLCVDIVCHGVPSKIVWNKYLRWQEQRLHSKLIEVDFRNKKDFGWRDHVETLYFENGKSVNTRIFTTLFYRHEVLRPSCYECPYKSMMHPGDITIADYWGIEKWAPEFDDNKGVSLVLVNNEVGEKFWECVKNMLLLKQTGIENAMQRSFIQSESCPETRDQFWRDFQQKSFSYIVRKYGGQMSFWRKILAQIISFIWRME